MDHIKEKHSITSMWRAPMVDDLFESSMMLHVLSLFEKPLFTQSGLRLLQPFPVLHGRPIEGLHALIN